MVYRIALFLCALSAGITCPRPAFAQADDGWRFDLAPLYFWAATTDGNLAIGGRTVPVYLDFSDAKDKLAGAFAFHGEFRSGRWGALGDINLIHLSSDVDYTVPIATLPIAGTVKLDQVIFNGAVMYAPRPGTPFDLVGGVRTYALSPRANFTGPLGANSPRSTSATRQRQSSAGSSSARSSRTGWYCSRSVTSAAGRRSPGAPWAVSSSRSGGGWA
jgi:hypothetical protein